MTITSRRSVVRVIPVDDSIFAREGLRAILKLDRGIKVVGEAGTVASALDEVHRAQPDVVIMDMRLPDGTGPNACRDILSAFPQTRILFFSAYGDDNDLYNAILAGGHGYLTKDVSARDLLFAIKTIAAGQSLLGPAQTDRVLAWVKTNGAEQPAPQSTILSPVDLTILSMLADGATNEVIATALKKEPNAVAKLLTTLYKKLNVRRRTQAVRHFFTHAARRRASGNVPGASSRAESETP